MTVEIKGADQLAALSKRLKELGDKDLSREFSRAITAATKPLVQDLRQSARETLPKRGGLNERVAKSQIRTQRRASSRTQGVRVVAKNPYVLARLDQGHVRHPVFGRNVWVDQTVRSGWWTRPTEAIGPDVRRSIEAAMAAMAKKLDGPL
jgi:hypothetical protein